MQILYSFESSLFYIMYGVYLADVILSESNYCNINGIGKILFLMRILVTLGMLGIIFLNKKIDIYKLIYSFCFGNIFNIEYYYKAEWDIFSVYVTYCDCIKE